MLFKYLNIKAFSLAFFMLQMFSCGKGLKVDAPIVKIGTETLYSYELEQMLPKDLSENDSTIVAEHAIRQWIDDVLLYEMARKNIRSEEKIERRVAEYRRQLIVHLYLEQLLSEKVRLQPNDSLAYQKRNDYLRRMKDELYNRAMKKGEIQFLKE
jgi:hypothetical protein